MNLKDIGFADDSEKGIVHLRWLKMA